MVPGNGRITADLCPTGETHLYTSCYRLGRAYIPFREDDNRKCCELNILKAAGLGWLLGDDETTPQKLLSDMAGYIPTNYSGYGL